MGISERKERERRQRRSDILDAAEEVFFSRGVESATMDEVAEVAEYSKGTLYLYFKNKNELLHGIIGRGMEMLLFRFREATGREETGLAKVAALGTAYFKFYLDHPKYFTIMQHQDNHTPDAKEVEKNPNICKCLQLGEETIGLMQEVVNVGIDDGTIRQDLDPLKLSLVLWGHTSGILGLIRDKRVFLEDVLKVRGNELVDYSHQLMLEYLVNRENQNNNEELKCKTS
ncbi:MAG: TetR/AcrR family transcriptional regulator [bacterium]|nr:TetR/AcrR family transcriptional regulator [bacterium]